MRIGEAVLELRQVRALPVGQVEDGDAVDFALRFFGRLVLRRAVDVRRRSSAPGRWRARRGRRRCAASSSRIRSRNFTLQPSPSASTPVTLPLVKSRPCPARCGRSPRPCPARAGRRTSPPYRRRVGVLEIHRLLDAGGAAMAGAIGKVLAGCRRAGRRTARTPRDFTSLPSDGA